ncbi:MAG: 50S ribosomal protein L6 [Thermoanaerobaculales bacterium]|jgi:large subunit ribosomal protein L6|nr:50S ribosomal protein L6 [Thermoanaerobaculales bacterium]
MSRIGRKPIDIPKGVEIKVNGNVVNVKGPKGVLDVSLPAGISGEMADGVLTMNRADEERETRAFHGLARALVANAVTGVSTGWSKALDIIGIGYRAEKQGNAVVFNLGHSHPINFEIPEGIDIDVDGKANRVTVNGIDRQKVGQVAAEIRGLRPPEPYKGKGVRYADERVRTKAGKQGATA